MFEFFVLCLVIVTILQYVYVGAILFRLFYKKENILFESYTWILGVLCLS